MKQTLYLYIAFGVVLLLLLNSCTTSRIVFDVMDPADIEIPEGIEADIEGLAGKDSTNSTTISKSVNAWEGEYIVYAYPASYTDMDDGNDYEDDGGTDFKFNWVSLAMTRTVGDLSITNPAGYTEDYEVYASDLANLGNQTLTASTSGQTVNRIYWGVIAKESGFVEADVEDSLANSTASNTKGRTFEVTAEAGEYIGYTLPKRLGTVIFYVGGFEGGFELPESLSVTNVNGWSEDYYFYRSSSSGLGITTVEVQ